MSDKKLTVDTEQATSPAARWAQAEPGSRDDLATWGKYLAATSKGIAGSEVVQITALGETGQAVAREYQPGRWALVLWLGGEP